MSGLPARVIEMAEMPLTEDVLLAILRDAFPDVPVYSLIPAKSDPFPFILARGTHDLGLWDGDPRFFDISMVAIHVFTEDPDGDAAGATLSEAVRVALRDAARRRMRLPDGSHLHAVTMTSRPRRVTDWATSSGPVQYADLPSGTYRYETIYRLAVRRSGT